MQPVSPIKLSDLDELPPRAREAAEALSKGQRLRSPLPRQRPTFLYYPGLPTQYFFDEPPPWARLLEQNWQSIRKEMEAVRTLEEGYTEVRASLRTGRWKTFNLWAEGRKIMDKLSLETLLLIVYGSKITVDPQEENCARCPITSVLLEKHVPIVSHCGMGYVYFSVLSPGAHITSHCGPTNARLRTITLFDRNFQPPEALQVRRMRGAHLGLDVPEKCSLRVATETRHWEEGKCMLFDDSFDHEVIQEGERNRVILLIDYWHPDLSEKEKAMLIKFLPAAEKSAD